MANRSIVSHRTKVTLQRTRAGSEREQFNTDIPSKNYRALFQSTSRPMSSSDMWLLSHLSNIQEFLAK